MKKGDKLYCKKTLTHHVLTHFIANNYYKITDVGEHEINIRGEYFNISFDINIKNYDDYKFKHYFCTQKELRLKKLKKLYGKG